MQYDQAADAGTNASSAVNGDAGHVADDRSNDLPKDATHWHKDAAVFGDLDACAHLLNREIVIGASLKGKRTPVGEWKNATYTLAGLFNDLSEHEQGAKDGVCILQGELAGGDRKADAVKACHIMMLDCDTGDDPDAVRAKIQSLGYFAMLWSTYSNGTSESAIPREALLRDIKKREGEQREPTLEDAKTWLCEEKGYRPEVLADAVAVDPKRHTPEAICFIVGHAPMNKFRILLPLARPFDFSDGVSQRERKEEWKQKIAEVSRLLGVHFDKSCVDPSRLMYTPRHPMGATVYWIDIVAGSAIDLGNLPKTVASKFEAAAANDHVIPKHLVKAGDYQTPWLRGFLAKNGNVFQVADFFEAHGEYRGPRNGPGAHYKCPNDDEHTDAGNPDDKGFYCVNAGEGDYVEGFIAKCMHASCAEKHRGHMLDLLCMERELAEADLLQFCDENLRQEEESAVVEAQAKSANFQEKAAKILAVLSAEDEVEEDPSDYTSSTAYDHPHIKRAMMVMSREWAVVTMGATVRYMRVPAEIDQPPTFFSKEAFQELYANKRINVPNESEGGGFKPMLVTKLWLEWPERRQFSAGVVFDPGADPDPKKYNLWRGVPTQARKGSWKRLRRHMFVNICKRDKRAFRWLLLWLAHLFQRPGEKIGSSVVLVGRKGTGKSKLAQWILESLKHHGIEVSDSEHIFSKFNAHTRGVILMVCEEAFWGGDKKAGGQLKSLITSERHLLELKGVDPVPTKNFMRLMFVSNEYWVVPAGMPDDERRYLILEVSDARQDDHDYFEAIDLEMEAGGLEAMVYDLQNIDPMKLAPGRGWKALRKPPATAAHVAQAEAGMDMHDLFFRNAINIGEWEAPERQSCSLTSLEIPKRDGIAKHFFISAKELRDHYEEYSDRKHIRPLSPRAFTARVRQWLLVEGSSEKATPTAKGSDGQVACYRLPGLEAIREHHEGRGLEFDALPD